MAYIRVPGHKDHAGADYWGTDRLERMVRTKDLESEVGALILLPKIESEVNSVIDLGSGIGRRHSHFNVSEYIGIDREKIMVDTAAKVFPDLNIYQGELMELSNKFPQFKNKFDLALTFHVVQYNHPIQQQEIFKNIYEVIKPGGYYYMKENTVNCPRSVVPTDKFEVCYFQEKDGHTVFRKI